MCLASEMPQNKGTNSKPKPRLQETPILTPHPLVTALSSICYRMKSVKYKNPYVQTIIVIQREHKLVGVSTILQQQLHN